MTPQLRKHRAALENKAQELSQTLRQRDRIAIEASAEETELTVLATQRDLAVQALDRNAQALREVRAALGRIDTGDFGVCERCEGEIAAKRLDALPWARHCVRCQEAVDREGPSRPYEFRFAA
jgi:DnaK suppressor protein